MSIGEKIQKLRKEGNYSQEEIANKLNVTRQTISKWETDQSTPDFDKIVPLCDLFGISTDEFLRGEITNKKTYSSGEEKNRHKSSIVVSFSVFLYFVSIVWIIISTEYFKLNEALSVGGFLLICSIPTVWLIYHFMNNSKSDEEVEKIKQKENKYVEAINFILAMVALGVYLLISFATSAWHITWIIWLIYAAVTKIVELIFGMSEKEIPYEKE